jgi:DNA-binding NarL/FixJ family response regulator
VAIVDIKMPPTYTDEGLRAAEKLRALYPDLGVLVLSQYLEVHYAMRLIENQVSGVGYLLKDRVSAVGEFIDAIHRVARGGSVVDSGVVAELLARKRAVNPLDSLTSREREVLSLMAEGRSNRAIQEALFVSPRTVETHVRNILMKLGLRETPDDHRRVLAVLAFLRS